MIVHNDPHPRNWLRDREGHIRITDFGLSWVFNDRMDRTAWQAKANQEMFVVRILLGLAYANGH